MYLTLTLTQVRAAAAMGSPRRPARHVCDHALPPAALAAALPAGQREQAEAEAEGESEGEGLAPPQRCPVAPSRPPLVRPHAAAQRTLGWLRKSSPDLASPSAL